MIRLRTLLLLLAVTGLFVSGAPASAATGDSALPENIAASAPMPALDAGQCAAPVTLFEASVPPSDFILCSCKFCKENPDVDCQISPSGYSILCADYSRLHNC